MTPIRPRLTTSARGITFAVNVQPRASRTAIRGDAEGVVRISLAAPPVDGQANEELIRFLAGRLHVPRRYVSIISGAGSKNKVILVEGIAELEVLAALTV